MRRTASSGSSNRIDLSASTFSLPDREELPPLAALFVIFFDVKAGYTIGWQRTVGNVDLEGVEFSSLPSGLHNLKEDLVYFVHGQYAGVSAFVNVPAGDEERGALMLSVGALVPLSYGRLGRSWRHAEGLKDLAKEFATDTSDYAALESYFTAHCGTQGSLESPPTKQRRRRSFSVSEPTLILPGQTLSPHHPALSLTSFVSVFGPLIFPIYRAALARKRILIITHAPVEPACNFVYDISILSNIPLSVVSLLPGDPERLKPLFSVGVHDIPLLETESKTDAGYVACTTDEILAMKTQLYDVLIRLPQAHTANADHKVWPTIEEPNRCAPPGSPGVPIKATQRDLRRFRTLQKSLHQRYRRKSSLFPEEDEDVDTPAAGPPEITTKPDADLQKEDAADEASEDGSEDGDDEPSNIEEICEHLTWREIAYSSFIWWASAGENTRSASGTSTSAHGTVEEDMDRLLDTARLSYPSPHHHHAPRHRSPSPAHSTSSEAEADGDDVRRRRPPIRPSVRRDSTATIAAALAGPEMDLIAYFHRFTQRIITTLANAVDAADNDVANNSDDDDDTTLGSGRGDEGEADRYQDEENEDARLLSEGQEEEPPKVWVSVEDLEAMGLDRYSDADAKAIAEILGRWWGREGEVQRWRFSCCGVECG